MKLGIICLSSSPCTLYLHSAVKKDDNRDRDWHTCWDYGSLNIIIKLDRYMDQHIQEISLNPNVNLIFKKSIQHVPDTQYQKLEICQFSSSVHFGLFSHPTTVNSGNKKQDRNVYVILRSERCFVCIRIIDLLHYGAVPLKSRPKGDAGFVTRRFQCIHGPGVTMTSNY